MTKTTITTQRLKLRPVCAADAPRVSKLSSDWDVARMVSMIPYPNPTVAVEGFLLLMEARSGIGSDHVFAIEHGGELIGMSGAHGRGGSEIEIGYWLGRDYWGHGFATEAAQAVAVYAEGLGEGPVVASHFADNPASGRVLEKSGFVYTGQVAPRFSLGRGENVDTRIMRRV